MVTTFEMQFKTIMYQLAKRMEELPQLPKISKECVLQLLTAKAVTIAATLLLISIWIVNIITLFFRRRQLAKEFGCKPPQSKALLKDPFLGLDFVYKTIENAKQYRYLDGTNERFKAYGTTYASKHLHYATIHTIDPANIQHVLATRFEDFKLSSFRVDAMVPLFGKGIFTTNGHAWKHSRALIRPSFDRHNIITHLEALEVHVQNFLALIPKDGSTVDLQDLFVKYTMDTGTEFLFGHSVLTLCPGQKTSIYTNQQNVEDAEFVDAYTYSCVEAAANIRLGALQHLKFSHRANRARKTAFAYIDGFVDEAIRLRVSGKLAQSENGGRYVFLRELAKDTGDREVLRDQILNILLAARDTTAALLSNMFWQLARHPEVYAKLREEVRPFGGEPPTINSLRDMKYLKMIINETLRMHPPVPANTREAIRDTFLPLGGGPDGLSPMFVKKGTQVYYSVYSMHRREEFFGAYPESFNPERWQTLKPVWEFLPFNGGPRICLGQQFSLTEASYLTVRLMQNFESMTPRDSHPWTEQYSMVAYSHYGTQVSLAPAPE